ncbi:DUF6939 family protein [Emticicia sp. TH156]|uniref:DUF6939 family protein n=1 Tax=Emticicia sp. TH156 TaxID=2067454 RepID=UPI000C78845B|nr:hypothetical protein [Emticicia sp. TH156]PLK42142.1 hypothetical protein C0V77_22420 [Emticicia sp. TH156]
MIYLDNKRASIKTILQKYPDALLLDVTSKSKTDYVKFSPFYPHGGIPIPFSEITSFSVEGIWQGLKVFENQDIDVSKFSNVTMKNLKRSGKYLGRVLGHRNGVNGKEILNYINARKQIYLPSYEYILKSKMQKEIEEIIKISQNRNIVLLDYNTNSDIENTKSPLSHASLIIKHILAM